MSVFTFFRLLGTQPRTLDPQEALLLSQCCKDARKAVIENWDAYWITWVPLLFSSESNMLFGLKPSLTLTTMPTKQKNYNAFSDQNNTQTSISCATRRYGGLDVVWNLPRKTRILQWKKRLCSFQVDEDLFRRMQRGNVTGSLIVQFYQRLLDIKKLAQYSFVKIVDYREYADLMKSMRRLFQARDVLVKFRMEGLGSTNTSSIATTPQPKLSLKRKFCKLN
jgi:hypothetical protein